MFSGILSLTIFHSSSNYRFGFQAPRREDLTLNLFFWNCNISCCIMWLIWYHYAYSCSWSSTTELYHYPPTSSRIQSVSVYLTTTHLTTYTADYRRPSLAIWPSLNPVSWFSLYPSTPTAKESRFGYFFIFFLFFVFTFQLFVFWAAICVLPFRPSVSVQAFNSRKSAGKLTLM